jgi:hypothetical protein
MARRAASTRLSDESWKEIFQSELPPQPLERRFCNGAFGTLFVSELPVTGKVAIKQVPTMAAAPYSFTGWMREHRGNVQVEQRSSFLNRELRMCSVLAPARHPFIVEVKGYWYTEDTDEGTPNLRKLHLMMEFVPQSLRSVLTYLNAHQMRMKASRATEYAFQVGTAAL